jgi:hypothetical protein
VKISPRLRTLVRRLVRLTREDENVVGLLFYLQRKRLVRRLARLTLGE